MRQIIYLSITMFVMPLLASCFEDNSIENSESDLVGEWYNNSDNRSIFFEETLTINDDNTFVLMNTQYGLNGSEKYMAGQTVSEGTYKVKGNRLSMKEAKAQHRMGVGRIPGKMEISEWMDVTDYSHETKTAEISFFQNNSTLLINKLYDPHNDSEGLKLFIRKGADLPYNNSDLQGTWYSFRKRPVDPAPLKDSIELFDAVNIAIKIKNDSIDLIFNSYGERYVGKYTYDNGVLSTEDTLALYTSWVDGVNKANWTDPYSALWRESYQGDPYNVTSFVDGYTFVFIPIGETAYFKLGYNTFIFKKQ